MAPLRLTKADLHRLFELLNEELRAKHASGEVSLVGGAVMCLALDAREATRDVDGFFRPTQLVREAAARAAARAGVPETWLNDAVKAYLGTRGEYDFYLDLGNLRVFTARPSYLLAMKCAALRLGKGFHDLDDVRYLLRYLNVSTVDAALAIVLQYFDETQIPPKTQFALQELLGG